MKRLAAAWGLTAALVDCHDVSERLPPLPSFQKQNRASVSKFLEADRAAREDPSSAGAVGGLGMLYHAYQYFDEARQCYELARRLDPRGFRFVYYGAKLEKSALRYEESERLFLRALELHPADAELWAELGDLYLMWARRGDASKSLEKALALDGLQPVAALGKARLLTVEQKWHEVIHLLVPLLERFPRLSKAHQFLAAAYGALGMEEKRAFHQEEGEYGSAIESGLMGELNELAVEAILDGDPALGPGILQVKCARCHDHERIYDHAEDRRWWAKTVRRMQREAGWDWLSDDEAADVVAYLSTRLSN